jgi:hypothetical protein
MAVRQLAQFQRVSLTPGQTQNVTLHLAARAFQYWSVQTHNWAFALGARTISVGDADATAHLPLSGVETAYPYGTSTPGGTVSSTLSISLGSVLPNLGSFVPGQALTYTSTMGATITSTAGSAILTAGDNSATAPGHLVNTSAVGGPYSLAQPLSVDATSSNAAASGGTYVSLGTSNPATILTYNAPVSNDAVTLGFQQMIGATDPLRTGSYTKTITLTLSTTTP